MDEKMQLAEWSRLFAENLMAERKRQGLTMEELSEKSQLSLSHYRTLEKGDGHFPSFPALVKLLSALRCAPTRLLKGIVDWNELDEYRGLSERFSGLKPHQLKKANEMLDVMFR